LLILWNILTLYCLLLCRYFDVGISTSKYLPMFFKISHFALKTSFLTVCIWRLIVFCYTAVPLYVTLFLILNFRSIFADLSGVKIRNIEMSCFAIRLCFVVLASPMLLRFAYKIRNFLYRVFTVKNNKKIQTWKLKWHLKREELICLSKTC
jgi:hypothetical protein